MKLPLPNTFNCALIQAHSHALQNLDVLGLTLLGHFDVQNNRALTMSVSGLLGVGWSYTRDDSGWNDTIAWTNTEYLTTAFRIDPRCRLQSGIRRQTEAYWNKSCPPNGLAISRLRLESPLPYGFHSLLI